MTAITDALFGARFLDKGGAVFNVKHPDFGAKGDGVTDDASAIQTAIDVGGIVFFPVGTYLKIPNISLPLQFNFILENTKREYIKPFIVIINQTPQPTF